MSKKHILILAAIATIGATGCDLTGLEKASKEMSPVLHDFVVELRRAQDSSPAIREFVEKSIKDFQNIPGIATGEMTEDGRGLIDFALRRVSENAEMMATVAEITVLLKQKDYDGAIRAIIKLKQIAKKQPEPRVDTVRPKSVYHVFVDTNDNFKRGDSADTLVFRGNDLMRIAGTNAYKLEVQSADGKWRDASQYLIITTPYTCQVNISTNGLIFSKYDKQVRLQFGDMTLASAPVTWGDLVKLPRVVAILVNLETTDNDKDKEIRYTFSVFQPGQQPAGEETVGDGDTWRDWTKRTIKVPIIAGREFYPSDRLKYKISIHYDSTNGDPDWWGRFSAEAVLEGGTKIDVMTETENFQLGHHDHGKIRSRVHREFPFNR